MSSICTYSGRARLSNCAWHFARGEVSLVLEFSDDTTITFDGGDVEVLLAMVDTAPASVRANS